MISVWLSIYNLDNQSKQALIFIVNSRLVWDSVSSFVNLVVKSWVDTSKKVDIKRRFLSLNQGSSYHELAYTIVDMISCNSKSVLAKILYNCFILCTQYVYSDKENQNSFVSFDICWSRFVVVKLENFHFHHQVVFLIFRYWKS